MKLSFSLNSKPKPSSATPAPDRTFRDTDPDHHEDPSQPQYVTEFDASQTLAPKPDLIIHPKPDTWSFSRRPNSLRNLPSSVPLDFEPESPSAAPASSYGLQLRPKDPGPEDRTLQRLREDLQTLPQDRGLDEFKDCPVDGFGAALLRGYGWSDDLDVDVKLPRYKRRIGTEGIGFDPDLHVPKPKRSTPPPSSPPPMPPSLPDAKPKGIPAGRVVRIVDGRHRGSKGEVVETPDRRIVVRLRKSGEEVTVGAEQIAELGFIEEDNCLRKLRRGRGRESSSSGRGGHGEKRDEGRSKDRSGRRDKDPSKRDEREPRRTDGKGGGRGGGQEPEVSWLTRHIRVRITSKDFKGGRHFLKKGEVVDVVGPGTCDVSMDGSKELIQGVGQEMLETALPKSGGPVLVLYGRHKGVYGNLVQRDKEREIGVVRDADTQALFKVRLEQIAEYLGDPSFLGY